MERGRQLQYAGWRKVGVRVRVRVTVRVRVRVSDSLPSPDSAALKVQILGLYRTHGR